MDKAERVKAIYAHLYSTGKVHTQGDFARLLNSTRASVSHILNGRPQYLTENLFRRLAVAFGDTFNTDWVLTGEGEMLVQKSGDITSSTVVGNNVNGNGINITNAAESETIALLREQLAIKDKEIERLHAIIEKLMER